jgi:hypothetical protein
MKKRRTASARELLRAFQWAREDIPDSGFGDDLELLQSKDLDLSIRLGALLAFDALLLTAAINPISASSGAPLSLDAPTQPWQVLVISISVLCLGIAAFFCVRGILIGEEFSLDGIDDNREAVVRRMFAAYCTSIDAQMRMIVLASRATFIGGVIAGFGCIWIMAEKIWG